MTLEQLQLLQYNENEHLLQMLFRLVDFSYVPEGEQQYTIAEGEGSLHSRLEMHVSLAKPSQLAIENEFAIYKAELIAAEEARLAEIARVAALKVRIAAFDADPVVPCIRLGLHIQQPNYAIIYKEIIEQNNTTLLAQMEAEWAAHQAELAAQQSVDIMDQLRAGRDAALAASDFTQLADVPLTTEEKAQYREYRRFLRETPLLYTQGRLIEPIVLTFEEWYANKEQYYIP